jgi:hypothetical protein
MRRMSIVLVALTLVTSVSGCSCCRRRQQVVAPAPVPVCPPVAVCPPASYDPCAPQNVTYGMPTTGYMMPAQ